MKDTSIITTEQGVFDFNDLKGRGQDFFIEELLTLFRPITRVKDARILQLLDNKESLVAYYDHESLMYTVSLQERANFASRTLDNTRLLEAIAQACVMRGDFVVQRSESTPYHVRRQVIRDDHGCPKTEFSPELGKKHRIYRTISVGLYEMNILN